MCVWGGVYARSCFFSYSCVAYVCCYCPCDYCTPHNDLTIHMYLKELGVDVLTWTWQSIAQSHFTALSCTVFSIVFRWWVGACSGAILYSTGTRKGTRGKLAPF